MSLIQNTLDVVGLGGLATGLAAVFGYGRLNHKVEIHSKELGALREQATAEAKATVDLAVALARLEERTLSIKEDVVQIREAVSHRVPL